MLSSPRGTEYCVVWDQISRPPGLNQSASVLGIVSTEMLVLKRLLSLPGISFHLSLLDAVPCILFVLDGPDNGRGV